MTQGLTPRFLLVDDHALLRRGLRERLLDELPEAQFGEAANGAEAIEQVSKASHDLVILDLSLAGRRSRARLERRFQMSSPKLQVEARAELSLCLGCT